jgi:hypothetical protein
VAGVVSLMTMTMWLEGECKGLFTVGRPGVSIVGVVNEYLLFLIVFVSPVVL